MLTAAMLKRCTLGNDSAPGEKVARPRNGYHPSNFYTNMSTTQTPPAPLSASDAFAAFEAALTAYQNDNNALTQANLKFTTAQVNQVAAQQVVTADIPAINAAADAASAAILAMKIPVPPPPTQGQ